MNKKKLHIPLLNPPENFSDKVMNRLYRNHNPNVIINLLDYINKEDLYPDIKLGNTNSFPILGQSSSYSADSNIYSNSSSQTISDNTSHSYGTSIPPFIHSGTKDNPEIFPIKSSEKYGISGGYSSQGVNIKKYQISKVICTTPFHITLQGIEKTNETYQFSFFIKSIDMDIDKLNNSLPHIFVSTKLNKRKLKLTYETILQGCSKCNKEIIGYKGKGSIQLNNDEISHLTFSLPNISNYNLQTTVNFDSSLITDIPIKNQKNKKVFDFDNIKFKISDTDINVTVTSLLTTDVHYKFSLFFSTDKLYNKDILVPNVYLYIKDETYSTTRKEITIVKEDCETCGEHILGYRIDATFDRYENFDSFQLDIPYLTLEELEQPTLNLNQVKDTKVD